METGLDGKKKIWINMDRSDVDCRNKTDDYYKNEIMPLCIKSFVDKNNIKDKCEGLILTLGTSYEPLVLSISALKPEKILILYTNETRELLDDVIELTGIKPSIYGTRKIDSESPIILYKTIKDIYKEWGCPKNIYVDFTGGTKSMAAGCAMAGSMIGARLIHIGSKYMKDLRKPEPGTEELNIIENPYTVFGELEQKEAINLFNKMDYSTAEATFTNLNNKGLPTKVYESLSYLSKAYDSWDSLNIKSAEENLIKCNEIIQKGIAFDSNFSIFISYIEKLKTQENILKKLIKVHSADTNIEDIFNNIGLLICNIFNNATRREKQKKYEMASLLLYRILEIISQKRLYNYGIITEFPDYSVLKINNDELLEKINKIVKKTNFLNPVDKLYDKISLLQGYILLAALDDNIIKTNKQGKESVLIMEMQNQINIRNRSLLAHGFQFIEKEKYIQFKNFVEKYFQKFCKLENIDMELLNSMEFINLETDVMHS